MIEKIEDTVRKLQKQIEGWGKCYAELDELQYANLCKIGDLESKVKVLQRKNRVLRAQLKELK